MSAAIKPLSGRRVFLYFLAFFGMVAMVNTVMVTLAVRTHSGLVIDHPYEKGIAYNNVVAAEKAQETLGWSASIGYAKGTLSFILKDKSGTPIKPEKATASITRPTQSGMDFNVELMGDQTSVTFPAKGVWDVRVEAIHEDVHYQQAKRIVVE